MADWVMLPKGPDCKIGLERGIRISWTKMVRKNISVQFNHLVFFGTYFSLSSFDDMFLDSDQTINFLYC